MENNNFSMTGKNACHSEGQGRNMEPSDGISRRSFIRTMALPVIAAPFIIPSEVWMSPPSRRITMGFVGMGKQSIHLLNRFLPLAQVLAVCDVDTTRRVFTQQKVDKYYSENREKGSAGCKAFKDYRELISRRDIDAVCIATPDHWHAEPVLLSLRKGKDVFCEKPLTHNLQEAIDIMQAVDKNGRVLQTGSMQRSMKEFRVACEIVRNGFIGKVSRVECSFGGPPVPCDLGEEEMEQGLDWNMWLGPAPYRPYNSILSPRGMHDHYPQWRSYREYGTGGVGDWGAHHLDIAQWGLGMDESGPVEVRFINDEATLIYGNGIKVIHKNKGFGVHFFGSEGEVMVNRGKLKVIINGRTIASFTGPESTGTTCMAEVEKAENQLLKNAAVRLYESSSHYGDFLSCMEKRTKPVTNEQIGGRSVICCHLINLLYFHNRPIQWDPAGLKFTGGTGDPSWLTGNYRNWKKAKNARNK